MVFRFDKVHRKKRIIENKVHVQIESIKRGKTLRKYLSTLLKTFPFIL